MESIIPVKIIQHTPFIHFQHNHLGATLRASDLKPRIDKYLGGTYRYQLTISSKLVDGYPKDKTRDDPYFGKHKLCRYEDIQLMFNTYFDSELKDKIEKILPQVFACENFGSFGSKGYGGFTVDDKMQVVTSFQKLLINKYKSIYYWDTNETIDEKLFFQIKYFYSLIKSGINIPKGPDKTYYKSLLMQYFLKDNIRWEKRGIKKKFRLIKSGDSNYLDGGDNEITDKEDYKAIKPLLGYSKTQKWLSYRKNIDIKFPDDIDRINSPFFFKVYRNIQNRSTRIYFMLKNDNELTNKILPNKQFNFTIDKTEPFYTPENFNFSNFLKYAVDNINNMSLPKSSNGKVDNFIRHLTTTKIQTL